MWRRSSWRPVRPRRRSRSSTSPGPATTSSPAHGSTAAPTTCSTTRCPSSASRPRFVEDPDDLDSWREAVRPNTKAFFGETISNPQIDILDIPGVASVAHDNGVPLIVDNTIATPYLIQPIAHGADIVVHSATKYLGGHGTAIAGVIVDSGNFDWTRGRPGFTTPDPDYHGVVFAELGRGPSRSRRGYSCCAIFGSAASPFNAFLVAQGLETLSLRINRHVANAQKVAEYLSGHDDVVSVNYAGLPSSPWYERGRSSRPRAPARCSPSSWPAASEAGKAFVNGLKLHSHVANIGDVRSLVIHPASTTHARLLPAEEQLATGVTPGLVRLAVGSRASTTSWRTSSAASPPQSVRWRDAVPSAPGEVAAF